GIAAASMAHGYTDSLTISRGKGSDQRPEVLAFDLRHIAEKDQRTVDIWRQCLEACLNRGTQTLLVIGVVSDRHVRAAHSLLEAARLKASDHNDCLGAAPQGRIDDMDNDRLALDKFEQLVPRRHAQGAPRSKNDGSNL